MSSQSASSQTSRYPIERHMLLSRSFVHLNGIGPRSEAALWRQGIDSWEKLHADAGQIYKTVRRDEILASLDRSFAARDRGDLHFFHVALPSNERWRLVQGAFDDVAYFDIEATGGNMPPYCQSTAIAFYFRGELLQEYDHRRKRDLIEFILAESAVLCTYNGGGYDIPFLRSEYGFSFAKAHVDLCPWLRRHGFKGGLKAIQRSMPHLHQRSSLDVDGFDAVRLWRMHEQGIPNALETLLTYNAEDALILEPLLVEAYNRELELRRPYAPLTDFEPLVSAPIYRLSTRVDPTIYGLLRARTSAESPDAMSYLARFDDRIG